MQLKLLVLSLFLIPMVAAVQYANVTLTAPGSNTTATFVNASADCVSYDVATTYITLTNCSLSSPLGFARVSLNLSTPNSSTDAGQFLSMTTPPGITSVSLSYAKTTPDTTLQRSLVVNDSTGLNVTVSYSWFVNGAVFSRGTAYNVSTNVPVNVANLSGAFSAGQSWTFGVTADNGIFNSSGLNTSAVSIDAYSNPAGSAGGGSGSGTGHYFDITGNTSGAPVNGSNTTAISPNTSTNMSVTPAVGSASFARVGWPIFFAILGVFLVCVFAIIWWVMRK